MPLVYLVFGVLSLSAGVKGAWLLRRRARLYELIAREIDLSKLADGIYAGTLLRDGSSYDLVVRVRDGRIVSVGKVFVETRSQTRRADASDAEAAQTDEAEPEVDVVSGATLSTKAFGLRSENLLPL